MSACLRSVQAQYDTHDTPCGRLSLVLGNSRELVEPLTETVKNLAGAVAAPWGGWGRVPQDGHTGH